MAGRCGQRTAGGDSGQWAVGSGVYGSPPRHATVSGSARCVPVARKPAGSLLLVLTLVLFRCRMMLGWLGGSRMLLGGRSRRRPMRLGRRVVRFRRWRGGVQRRWSPYRGRLMLHIMRRRGTRRFGMRGRLRVRRRDRPGLRHLMRQVAWRLHRWCRWARCFSMMLRRLRTRRLRGNLWRRRNVRWMRSLCRMRYCCLMCCLWRMRGL